MDPSDSNTLFAGTFQYYDHQIEKLYPGGVYKSVDGRKNWRVVLTDDPPLSIFNIGALAISPVDPDIIFAGAPDYPYHDICLGEGIFVSIDSGET